MSRTNTIPKDLLPDFIGKGVHLAWAKRGCWWILESIDRETANLRTPQSGKKIQAHINDICYIEKHDPVAQQRAIYEKGGHVGTD